MLKKLLRKLFNNKRTTSQYIKFEDGTVKTVNDLSDPDSAPKLSNNVTLDDDEIPVKKERNFWDKVGLFAVSLIFIGLIFLFFFIGKYYYTSTKNFVINQNSPVNSISTNDVNNVNDVNNTNTVNNANVQANTTTTSVDTNVIPTIKKKNSNNYSYADIVKYNIEVNQNISNILKTIRDNVSDYYNNKSNRYVIDSMLNRETINVNNSLKSFQNYSDSFKSNGADNLYNSIEDRYKNLSDLIAVLKSNSNKDILVDTTNSHIINDNKLFSNEISNLIDSLKNNNIGYRIENNQLILNLTD